MKGVLAKTALTLLIIYAIICGPVIVGTLSMKLTDIREDMRLANELTIERQCRVRRWREPIVQPDAKHIFTIEGIE